MYFVDFIKKLGNKSNIGITIYLIINVIIIIALFTNGFQYLEMIPVALLLYVASLAIALSPIGESILRLQTGCKKIKENHPHYQRLELLFNEVYAKAKEVDINLQDNIKLYLSKTDSINAFATGRKTICVTEGLLECDDNIIKAVLAHEFGHLSNKDTDIILVVTVGNLIVTTVAFIFRIVLRIAYFVEDSWAGAIGIILFELCLTAIMWLWTRIGFMLCMHSSRKNEYNADLFARELGYGQHLVQFLSEDVDDNNLSGLWATLHSSHPQSSSRIENLNNYQLI